jgi:membrane protein YdbS with pleckstrin-like domain
MQLQYNTKKDRERSQAPTDSSHEVRMRWFILIVISVSLLASLAASIALMFMTRNPLALALPSSVLVIVLPVIRYLFPQKREKGAKNDQGS